MSDPESGQSLVETILLGLLLLVPLVWALGVLADLHRTALAASAAAREAGFEAATSPSLAEANGAVERAVAQAFMDHGVDPAAAQVRWAAPAGLARGGTVEVSVNAPVTVLQAPLLGRVTGPSVWVRARHLARIDPYRSRK
jgi:hypothetical protein